MMTKKEDAQRRAFFSLYLDAVAQEAAYLAIPLNKSLKTLRTAMKVAQAAAAAAYAHTPNK